MSHNCAAGTREGHESSSQAVAALVLLLTPVPQKKERGRGAANEGGQRRFKVLDAYVKERDGGSAFCAQG